MDAKYKNLPHTSSNVDMGNREVNLLTLKMETWEEKEDSQDDQNTTLKSFLPPLLILQKKIMRDYLYFMIFEADTTTQVYDTNGNPFYDLDSLEIKYDLDFAQFEFYIEGEEVKLELPELGSLSIEKHMWMPHKYEKTLDLENNPEFLIAFCIKNWLKNVIDHIHREKSGPLEHSISFILYLIAELTDQRLANFSDYNQLPSLLRWYGLRQDPTGEFYTNPEGAPPSKKVLDAFENLTRGLSAKTYATPPYRGGFGITSKEAEEQAKKMPVATITGDKHTKVTHLDLQYTSWISNCDLQDANIHPNAPIDITINAHYQNNDSYLHLETPPNSQIVNLNIYNQTREKEVLAFSYTLKQDNNGYYYIAFVSLPLTPEIYTITMDLSLTEPKEQDPLPAPLANLDKKSLITCIEHLEEADLGVLPQRLRTLVDNPKDVSIQDLELIFQNALDYTYDDSYSFSSNEPVNRFSRFSGFLNSNEKLQVQCDIANLLYSNFLNLYFENAELDDTYNARVNPIRPVKNMGAFSIATMKAHMQVGVWNITNRGQDNLILIQDPTPAYLHETKQYLQQKATTQVPPNLNEIHLDTTLLPETLQNHLKREKDSSDPIIFIYRVQRLLQEIEEQSPLLPYYKKSLGIDEALPIEDIYHKLASKIENTIAYLKQIQEKRLKPQAKVYNTKSTPISITHILIIANRLKTYLEHKTTSLDTTEPLEERSPNGTI